MVVNQAEVHPIVKEFNPGCTLLRAEEDDGVVLEIIGTQVAGVAHLNTSRRTGHAIEAGNDLSVHN